MRITAVLLFSFLSAWSGVDSLLHTEVRAWQERCFYDNELVNIRSWAGLRFDIRYATKNNFTGRNLYGKERGVFLHREAATKLHKALEILGQQNPGYSFVVYDALRPPPVQRALYEKLRGTPLWFYVSHPDRGSVHSFGMALDIGLADENGKVLDMGTDFDSFELLAQPRQEDSLYAAGKLSKIHLENRHLLRGVLTLAGWRQLATEWWHFNAAPTAVVRKSYRMIR